MAHPELAAEQAHIDRAYERVAEMRAVASDRLRTAFGAGESFAGLGHERPEMSAAVEEREVMVHTALQRLEQLDIGEESLCFGRIDREEGDAFHIGRLGVSGRDNEPLVVDWRAPVAEPFYRATGRHPLGLRRRRHFLTEGRRIVDIEDEHFAGGEAGDELGLAGTGVLLAALERSRTGRMRDIVATVQREQDEIIRAPLPGILVVQGGPGTGKTAVALHRAAYLLYTHRFPLERQGVLVLGPNPLFLRYIEHVLPSLGESGVELSTVEGLYGHARVTGRDAPDAAAVKGDARMSRVIARAVRDRERPIPKAVDVPFGIFTLRITPEMTAEVVGLARRRGGSHNSRRRFVEQQLWKRLHTQYANASERAARTGIGAAADISAAELGRQVRREPAVAAVLDRIWPVLTPQELLRDLFGASALLRLASRGVLGEDEVRCLRRDREANLDGVAWTAADVPLLDEAAALLGSARRDDEEAVRAFGHIVVDEAQDLSPMQLRMIARRSISGSLTIVGDLGQATGHWSPGAWEDVIAHLPDATARGVELTVSYRTPAEILELAGRVLAVAAPDLQRPDAVRSTGVEPLIVAASEGAVGAAAAEAVRAEVSAGAGTIGIVCPGSLVSQVAAALDAVGVAYGEPARHGLEEQVTIVPTELAKGLEFDSVVVVEPSRLAREAPQGLRALYVALTRATQRLTVVHSEPLPEPMRSAG